MAVNLRNSLNKEAWQNELSCLVTDPHALLNELKLDPTLLPAARAAAEAFPLKVTSSFIRRMEKGNADDPLLKQVLPLGVELVQATGFTQDPLHERSMNPIPGLLHKYKSRVLITITSACAVHCRYCFRRSFPYADNKAQRAAWPELLAYIEAHPDINEVILSGGDPMTLGDGLLQSFTDALRSLPQIKRLRIHTRTLIVLPSRVTEALVAWLTSLPWPVVIVVHVNHPNEIDDEVASALQSLRSAGITLFNQSVLLREINDDEAVLTALQEKLFSVGVLPYYLHTLDKVNGAAHFDVSLSRARALHAHLKQALPGFLVPKLVTERPAELSKTWL